MPKGSLKSQFKSEYSALKNAIRRCTKPKCPQYDDYGGRGVKVCAAWSDPLTGFAAFIQHIGRKPDPSFTLERIDNSKGYEPGNVDWVSRQANMLNRRPSRKRDLGWGSACYTRVDSKGRKVTRRAPLIEHQGLRLTANEWSARTGLAVPTIIQRIQRGWTPAQALDPLLRNPRGGIRSDQIINEKEDTPMEYPDAPNYLHDATNPVHMILAHLTARLNDQSQTIAELRTDLAATAARLDEAQHMTSDEYGDAIVEKMMSAIPAIQAQAMKAAKRGGRR